MSTPQIPPQQTFQSTSYIPSTPPPPPPKPSTQSNSPFTGPPQPPPPRGTHEEWLWDNNRQQYYRLDPQTNAPIYASNPPDHGPPPPTTHHEPQPPSIPPPSPGWLPANVRDKATPDLHALLSNPALLTALAHSHPSIPASTAPLSALLSTNITLAHRLLALESALAAHRAATQSRLLALRALEQQWRGKQAAQDAGLQEFAPSGLYRRLNQAVAEQEMVCRGVEESFLEGDGRAEEREVVEWVKRVREGRKVAFLRREGRERWDEGRVGGWR